MRANVGQDAVKDKFRYVCVGSLDDPEALPPKGEFFCKSRASWMPEIPSKSVHKIVASGRYFPINQLLDVFHKQEIKE